MKNTTITFLLGFFFLVCSIKSIGANGPNADSSICLEIEGIVLNANDGAIKTCTVELLCASRVEQSIQLKDGKKKVKFLLKKNATYTIRITKKEHVTKLICIDTRIKKNTEDLYSFSFETSLLPESIIDKENRDYLDFPVALIYYDARKDHFTHDKDYANRIKKEIALK